MVGEYSGRAEARHRGRSPRIVGKQRKWGAVVIMAFLAESGGALPSAFTGAYAAIAAQFKRLPSTMVVGQDRGTA